VSKIIKEFHPKYNVISNRFYPRSGAFEIEINGKIVFSKFETNSFPSKEDIKTLLKIK
tara:strand:+ start:306 stop:479 length:174 start_codon:yes stop_codon:yes gene_type:complete